MIRRRKDTTDEQIEQVVKMYPHYTTGYIYRVTGVSPKEIERIAQQRRVVKTKEFILKRYKIGYSDLKNMMRDAYIKGVLDATGSVSTDAFDKFDYAYQMYWL